MALGDGDGGPRRVNGESENCHSQDFSRGEKLTDRSSPGGGQSPQRTVIHGYWYTVRYWYIPSQWRTERILAAWDEDLAKEMARQYPGAHYDIVHKKPILGF